MVGGISVFVFGKIDGCGEWNVVIGNCVCFGLIVW